MCIPFVLYSKCNEWIIKLNVSKWYIWSNPRVVNIYLVPLRYLGIDDITLRGTGLCFFLPDKTCFHKKQKSDFKGHEN
jgi:hypothetical protein